MIFSLSYLSIGYAMSRFAERVVEKIKELDARMRALERSAEDDTTLTDLRTSMEILTQAVTNALNSKSLPSAQGAKAQPGSHGKTRPAHRPPPDRNAPPRRPPARPPSDDATVSFWMA